MPRRIAVEQTPGRQRRSAEKQARILSAAQALFVANGYDGTSIDAVAARAEVSKRTIYDHFGGKQDVFLHVLELANTALTEMVRTAIAEELPPGRPLREGLLAFTETLALSTVTSREYEVYRTLVSRPSSAPSLDIETRDRAERLLRDRLGELIDQGALRAADPDLAAAHLIALTLGLAFDSIRDERGDDAVRIVLREGVDVFLRAYS